MSMTANISKAFKIISLLCVAWSVFFIKGTLDKKIPAVKLMEIKSSWKNKKKAQDNLKSFRVKLEDIRQFQSVITDDNKKFKNIFALEIERPKTFVFCEECGGKNIEGATICVHCGAIIAPPTLDRDKDGMPDYWEMKYELDPRYAEDAGLDPDKDSRSNVQEFRDGTNPLISDVKGEEKNIESSLPFALLKSYQKPVQILFMGYIVRVNGEYNVQVNWGGKTDFYNLGDDVRGYVIKDFQKVEEEVFDDKTGVPRYIDRSFIICQKKKFPPKTFYKQKLVTDNDVFAKVEFIETGESREVYIDSIIEDSFTGKNYKVIDIGLNPAKIIVEDDEKKHILYKNK